MFNAIVGSVCTSDSEICNMIYDNMQGYIKQTYIEREHFAFTKCINLWSL